MVCADFSCRIFWRDFAQCSKSYSFLKVQAQKRSLKKWAYILPTVFEAVAKKELALSTWQECLQGNQEWAPANNV
jgi:hypothetical protein